MTDTRRNMRWDQLTVFSLLYGIALILHVMPGTSFAVREVTSIFVVLAGAALILRPASTAMLLAAAALQVLDYAAHLPVVSNHYTLFSFLSVFILIRGALSLRHTAAFDRGHFYDQIAVIGRLLLLCMYALAVLHKLNPHFFDPQASCALFVYDFVGHVYGLPAASTLGDAAWLLIFATIGVEAGIPLLLIFPQTRKWGILLGMLFHGMLGLGQYYDFAALLSVFFFLYTPPDFLQRLYQQHGARLRRLRRHKRVGLGILAFVCILALRFWVGVPLPYLVFVPFWMLWAACLLYLYLTTILQPAPPDKRSISDLISPLRPGHAILIALFLFNGFAPYLGLKTNYSFDMYSNLQVELNESNHAFLPMIPLWQYTNDTVALVESDIPQLQDWAEKGWHVTRHELNRQMLANPTATTTVRYNGEVMTLSAQTEQLTLGEVNAIAQKLLYFGPIVSVGQQGCAG